MIKVSSVFMNMTPSEVEVKVDECSINVLMMVVCRCCLWERLRPKLRDSWRQWTGIWVDSGPQNTMSGLCLSSAANKLGREQSIHGAVFREILGRLGCR